MCDGHSNQSLIQILLSGNTVSSVYYIQIYLSSLYFGNISHCSFLYCDHITVFLKIELLSIYLFLTESQFFCKQRVKWQWNEVNGWVTVLHTSTKYTDNKDVQKVVCQRIAMHDNQPPVEGRKTGLCSEVRSLKSVYSVCKSTAAVIF